MIVGRDYETVLERAKAYNEHGLEGLESDRPSGRPSSLTTEQQDDIKKTAQMSPRKLNLKFSNWNCKNLSWWISRHFGVKLRMEAVHKLLHKLGFVLIRPTYNAKVNVLGAFCHAIGKTLHMKASCSRR